MNNLNKLHCLLADSTSTTSKTLAILATLNNNTINKTMRIIDAK